jgi:hypothetical protein
MVNQIEKFSNIDFMDIYNDFEVLFKLLSINTDFKKQILTFTVDGKKIDYLKLPQYLARFNEQPKFRSISLNLIIPDGKRYELLYHLSDNKYAMIFFQNGDFKGEQFFNLKNMKHDTLINKNTLPMVSMVHYFSVLFKESLLTIGLKNKVDNF